MPEWKRKKDPIIARYIHRPISFLKFFCGDEFDTKSSVIHIANYRIFFGFILFVD